MALLIEPPPHTGTVDREAHVRIAALHWTEKHSGGLLRIVTQGHQVSRLIGNVS